MLYTMDGNSTMTVTTSTTTPSHVTDRDGNNAMIRLKLFNRLGIHPPMMKRSFSHINKNASKKLHNAQPFRAPLRDDDDDDRFHLDDCDYLTSSGTSRCSCSCCDPESEHDDDQNKQKRQKKTIQFDSQVWIVPIPHWHQYSPRIRSCLWSNGHDIEEMARRNRTEFACEDWDWHKVLEDEDMFVDATTGELVHPCWLQEEKQEDSFFSNGPSLTRTQSFSTNLRQLSL